MKVVVTILILATYFLILRWGFVETGHWHDAESHAVISLEVAVYMFFAKLPLAMSNSLITKNLFFKKLNYVLIVGLPVLYILSIAGGNPFYI